MIIITKSHLQKNIGSLNNGSYTVVNRGKPEIVIVPYFEGSEEWVQDYLEEYEMIQHRKKLQKELRKSKKSGRSDLTF